MNNASVDNTTQPRDKRMAKPSRTAKSPARRPGLKFSGAIEGSVFRHDGRAEGIIDAGTEDVVVEADRGLVGRSPEIGRRTEVEVKIFELGRPVGAELLFQTGAQGPTDTSLRFRQ